MLDPPKTVIRKPSDTSSFVLEQSGATILNPTDLYTQYDDYNRQTAPYVYARLNAWLENNPDRKLMRIGPDEEADLTDAMSGLDISGGVPDTARTETYPDAVQTGACTAQTGTAPEYEPGGPGLRRRGAVLNRPASRAMLFADLETQSPEELGEHGFESQTVYGNDWMRSGKGTGKSTELYSSSGDVFPAGCSPRS